MSNLSWRFCSCRSVCVTLPSTAGRAVESLSPEVLHELFELVRAPGQRDDDVDRDVGRVHPLVLHLHQRSKGPEQDQSSEFITRLPSEGQLVQRPFVLLCTSDAWSERQRREGVNRTSL